MFRYSRTVTLKNGAGIAPALRAAAELTAYVNKAYGFQMKVGAQLFGPLKIHWYNDVESLGAVPEFAMKAAQDKMYGELLEKIKPFVLEGSVQDDVVQLVG